MIGGRGLVRAHFCVTIVTGLAAAVLAACGTTSPSEGVKPTLAAHASLPPLAASDFPAPPISTPSPWSELVSTESAAPPHSGIGIQMIGDAVAYRAGFVAVGEDVHGDGSVNGAIWASPDGRSWSMVDVRQGDLADAAVHQVATDGQRLVAIGSSGTAFDAPADPVRILWLSGDGVTWRRLPEASQAFADISGLQIVGGASGFVAWGDANGGTVIFHSNDGLRWDRSPTGTGLAGMQIRAVKPYRGGFVAVGAQLPPTEAAGSVLSNGGPDGPAAAWWSPDGRSWGDADVDPGYGLLRLEVGAQGLLAFGGGSCSGCVGPAIVWRSDDGRRWRQLGSDVADWPAYGSDGARIIRFDYQGSGAVSVSTDGEAWQRLGDVGIASTSGLTVGANGVLVSEGEAFWYLAAR